MATYTIDTKTPSRPTPPPRRNQRKLVLCCAGAALAAGIGLSIYALRGDPKPPPPTADPKTIVQYTASEQFAQLKPEEKKSLVTAITQDARKFIDAARNSGMTEEQRRDAMRNIFIARAQQHVEAYYALPPGPERTKYMDSVIDEMEKRRAEMQAMRQESTGGQGNQMPGAAQPAGQAGTPAGPGGPMQGVNAERIKTMMESIPPEQRARFAEFRKAMSDRREQRGLPEMWRP